jgi:hypothetical protein
VNRTPTINEKWAGVIFLVAAELGLNDLTLRPGDFFGNIPGEANQFERINRDRLMGFTAVPTALTAR